MDWQEKQLETIFLTIPKTICLNFSERFNRVIGRHGYDDHAERVRDVGETEGPGVVDEDLSESRRDSLDGRWMVANIAKAIRQRSY